VYETHLRVFLNLKNKVWEPRESLYDPPPLPGNYPLTSGSSTWLEQKNDQCRGLHNFVMCNKEFKCNKRLLSFQARLARDKLQQVSAFPLRQNSFGMAFIPTCWHHILRRTMDLIPICK
jgi:hypothetical protein